MSELPFHNKESLSSLSLSGNLIIINKLIAVYKLWDNFKNHFPKRYKSLVIKIDSLLIEILELFFSASKLNKEQKLPVLNKASGRLDTLKFFLQFSWEVKAMDNRRYILISKDVAEIGRMLGSWLKSAEKQTLPK